MALQPLLVLATKHPSVVAIGTENSFPLSSKGPAIPTGTDFIGIFRRTGGGVTVLSINCSGDSSSTSQESLFPLETKD
ncbi:hypothetical protein H5410_013955 [Solanum commersonii]|uniref:Uncharacterized protein n=1 Tax=Solanum commersonii TaxID=4109 RepID=A0A9J5ZPV2_SOLCO|nr:hypothetical protein H5410_013955 [Solanum commersonii]